MIKNNNTKFFTFVQNNSGGYFINNDEVSHYLIIESECADDAINKMHNITKNYSEYCPCCGERWDDWLSDEDAEDEPMIYGTPVHEMEKGIFNKECIIYYLDGRKEKIKLK